jgi:hypothetical protein
VISTAASGIFISDFLQKRPPKIVKTISAQSHAKILVWVLGPSKKIFIS